MSEQQRQALDELLREGPLDIGGDVVEQRVVFEQLMAAQPLPDGVRTERTALGGVPAVDVTFAGRAARDVVFYLHGGGYVLGSAQSSVGLVSEVARRAGARATTIDYRLAPEHPYPAALDDAVTAYRALTAEVDPARVVVVGESAGAGLALAMLVALRDAGDTLPAAAAVMSPWADLGLTGESVTAKAGVDPALTAEGLHRRAADYAPGADLTTPTISPVHADLRGLPPLLIQAGSHEILLDDALRLAARAARDDVAVELSVTPNVPHVFQGFAALLDEAGQALDAIGAFLRRFLPA